MEKVKITGNNIQEVNGSKHKRGWLRPFVIAGFILVIISISIMSCNSNQGISAETNTSSTETKTAYDSSQSTAVAQMTKEFNAIQKEQAEQIARAESAATFKIPSVNGTATGIKFFSFKGDNKKYGREFSLGSFDTICYQLDFSASAGMRKIELVYEVMAPDNKFYSYDFRFDLVDDWSDVFVYQCSDFYYKKGIYLVNIYDGDTKVIKGTFDVN